MSAYMLKVLYKTLIALGVASFIGVVGTAIAVTAPVGLTSVTGVTVESSRDIHKHPEAPVTYTWNGVERTEFVAVEALANETVTFDVDASGGPTARGWVLMLGISFLTAISWGAILVLFGTMFIDVLQRRIRWAEYRENNPQYASTH